MKTEYVVEIYNKYHSNFQERIKVFPTYDEAKAFVDKKDFDLDEDSEYVEITEIEYDNESEEKLWEQEV